MKMENSIKIIHLSDAHIGHPDYKYDEPSVFDPFFEDIKKEVSIPDMIIFSGDLVYGQVNTVPIAKQYDNALKFLDRLYSCFGKINSEIPILIVPGNHDVDRKRIDDSQKEYRNTFKDDKIYKWMNSDDDITWKRIIERQEEWNKFIHKIPEQPWDIDDETNTLTGVLNIKGLKIGVAGFNSSWASQDDSDNGKLWIGKYQFQKAYEKIKDSTFLIAVSHHPCDWLHADDKKYMLPKIETKFHMHFHGHEHSTWFFHSQNHLRLVAGACYCRSNKKGHGYTVLNLNKQIDKINLKFRTYTDDGGGAWIPHVIPGKTNEDGITEISFNNGNKPEITINDDRPSVSSFLVYPNNLPEFCSILENYFNIRKECTHNCNDTCNRQIVYWPVRLRRPTPIHAAQSFLAGGLQKMGCRVSLWIDDLGRTEYSTTRFIQKLKQWYGVVGGNSDFLSTNKFSDILNSNENHIKPAWTMLQKWLGNMAYYTDHVLKISKIWPAISDSFKEDPEIIISDIKKRRACRLMTPSMVWTCLSVLHDEYSDRPLITLGGYDEKELWDAWRTCTESAMDVCHLYVSQLTQNTSEGEKAIHMTDNPLAWECKDDIKTEFDKILDVSNSETIWNQKGNMIPWIINNCVLLPAFIKNEKTLMADKEVVVIDNLNMIPPFKIYDELIEAVNKWLN